MQCTDCFRFVCLLQIAFHIPSDYNLWPFQIASDLCAYYRLLQIIGWFIIASDLCAYYRLLQYMGFRLLQYMAHIVLHMPYLLYLVDVYSICNVYPFRLLQILVFIFIF